MATEKIFYSSGNDPDVDLWLAQITGGTSAMPSLGYINNLNSFVNTLKSTGIWLELDRLWILASEQEQHAQISLVNPSSTRISIGVQPTFTANIGYSGNGSNQYLNTNYTPSINAVKASLNSINNFYYCRTNSSGNTHEFSVAGSLSSLSLNTTGAGNFNNQNNATTSLAIANTISYGLISALRTSSTNVASYINGNSIVSGSIASVALPDFPFFICARNISGGANNFSSRQISMCGVGSGNINQLTFYNAIQNFAISRGFNV